MKSRRVIFYVTLGLIVITLSAALVWRLLPVEDKLRNLIVEEFQTYFEGEMTITKLTIKPNSLLLEGVYLELPNRSIELYVKNLELGFSYYNALKYNFNPIRLVSEVVLEQPVFRIYTKNNKSVVEQQQQQDFDLKNLRETYENRLIDINFVGKIVINNGVVSWFDDLRKEIRLVNGLNGWISTTDLENSNVRMSGSLFRSDNENVILSGQADLKSGVVDSVTITFFDDNLSTTIPTLFPDILRIEKGQLVGHGVLKENKDRQLALFGTLNLSDANLSLFGGKVELDSFNTVANINDWNLDLVSCTMRSFNSPIEIKGKILNVLKPNFDLTALASGVVLDNVLPELLGEGTEVALSGVANAEVRMLDDVKTPRFSARVTSPELAYSGQKFRRVKTDFSYAGGILEVKDLSADVMEFKVTATGSVVASTDQKELDLKLGVYGDLRSLIPGMLNQDYQFPLRLGGELKGDFKDFGVNTQFEVAGYGVGSDSIHLEGSADYKSGEIFVALHDVDSPFDLSVRLHPLNDRVQFRANVLNFGGDLWDLTSLPGKNHLKRFLDLNCELTGDEKYATYALSARRRFYTGESNELFNVEGFYSSSRQKSNIVGDITYHPDTGGMISGDIEIEMDPDSINLKNYRLGDFYSANAVVQLNEKQEISGSFKMNNADLTYVLDGLLMNPSFAILGLIDGNIVIDGTMENPIARGSLSFEDLIYRGDGYYSGDAEIVLSDNKVRIERLDLSLEDRHLLAAVGTVGLKDKEMDIEVTGKDVHVPTLLNIIVPQIDFIEARADFDLKITDKLSSPHLHGDIVAKEGKLFFVNFDTLAVKIGRPDHVEYLVSANGNGSSHSDIELTKGLYLSDIQLKKNKKYEITGSGFLPFRSDEDLDLRLTGSGDAFAVLFADLPFVRGSRSESTFSWGFGGTYNNVVYTEGNISVKKGELRLEDIAPVVKNINIDAIFEPDNQFVRVSNLSGQIDGSKFYAITKMDSIPLGRGMEPLFISAWGLNFGAVYIKTEKKGVPLHIPGAMLTNEEGRFEVKGAGRDPYLVVTGPEEHPIASGEISVKDASFTFPFEFEETAAAEPSLTEKILQSMVWDVRMIPTKDVRYVKQLPGFIDNIWINALIDPKISELKFSGIFEDESFRIEGLIRSSRGSIEYLDFNFGVELFAAEFDLSDVYPIVYGRARTTFTDSLGVPSNIYLTLYVYDPENKQELERGRWNEDIRFRLSSDNPLVGTNEIQVLASLGYSINTIGSKATDVISLSTDNLLFRPLFRPVERKLEKTLGLDAIRFRSRFTRNFMDLNSDLYSQVDPRYLIFRSTQVTLGKYLTENLFLNYSGQLEAGLDPRYQEDGVGLKHTLDLEYRIYPNLLLELQYNYDSLLRIEKEDKRVQIRHSFVF